MYTIKEMFYKTKRSKKASTKDIANFTELQDAINFLKEKGLQFTNTSYIGAFLFYGDMHYIVKTAKTTNGELVCSYDYKKLNVTL